MTPKHGQNILREDSLKDEVLVHQTVVNISGYENLCFKRLLPESINETRVKQKFVISSPLELAGARFEHLRAVLCKNQTKWEMKNFDPST